MFSNVRSMRLLTQAQRLLDIGTLSFWRCRDPKVELAYYLQELSQSVAPSPSFFCTAFFVNYLLKFIEEAENFAK